MLTTQELVEKLYPPLERAKSIARRVGWFHYTIRDASWTSPSGVKDFFRPVSPHTNSKFQGLMLNTETFLDWYNKGRFN